MSAARPKNICSSLALLAPLGLLCAPSHAAPARALQASASSPHYVIEDVPLPEGAVVEIGALALLPENRVAVATRRGEVWIGTGVLDEDLGGVRWSRFAEGLHEPFGLYWREGALYATQKSELTRILDTDGDGQADRFDCVNGEWGFTGDFHEFAFGSDPDANGDTWITLCLTKSFESGAPFRGWAVRITPDGRMIPTCGGVRSPGGIGRNAAGDLFYCDNQGHWNGTSSLKHLAAGRHMGCPVGNEWYDRAGIGPRPRDPEVGSGVTVEGQRARIPELLPPAVLMPHGIVGQSPTGIVFDGSRGAFGPFSEQLLVADVTHSKVNRVLLEKVGGVYQGAVLHFLEGFNSGPVAVRLTPEGMLLVGQTNRGWGSRGPLPYSLQRVRWLGSEPFEVLDTHITARGWRLTFTRALDPATVTRASFALRAWTYAYHKGYGSPEVDVFEPSVEALRLSDDGRTLELDVDERRRGHVHEIALVGVRGRGGAPLDHDRIWYTVNELPPDAPR